MAFSVAANAENIHKTENEALESLLIALMILGTEPRRSNFDRGTV